MAATCTGRRPYIAADAQVRFLRCAASHGPCGKSPLPTPCVDPFDLTAEISLSEAMDAGLLNSENATGDFSIRFFHLRSVRIFDVQSAAKAKDAEHR